MIGLHHSSRWLHALIAALVLLVADTALGQAGLAPIAGRWPASAGLNRNEDGSPMRGTIPLTAAQRAEMEQLVQRVERIFREAQALKRFDGYEVILRASTEYKNFDNRRYTSGAPIPLNLSLLFFELFRSCPSCKVERAREASGAVQIWINDLEAAVDGAEPRPQQAGDQPWWKLKRVMGEEHGLPVYEGGYGGIIVTGSNRPLGLPVSRQAYLDRVLTEYRSKLGSAVNTMGGLQAEQQQALADMAAAARQLEALDPAAAAQMRQSIEASRRQLAAEQPAAAAEANQGLAAAQSVIAQLERERALLSPSQLLGATFQSAGPLPSYRQLLISPDDREVSGQQPEQSASGLAQDERWGRSIVTLNRAFFDGTLPSTTPQLLVMESRQSGDPLGATPSELGDGLFALRQGIYESIDWSALTALVGGTAEPRRPTGRRCTPVIYTADASANPTGRTYRTVRDALGAAAAQGDCAIRVNVAAGTYGEALDITLPTTIQGRAGTERERIKISGAITVRNQELSLRNIELVDISGIALTVNGGSLFVHDVRILRTRRNPTDESSGTSMRVYGGSTAVLRRLRVEVGEGAGVAIAGNGTRVFMDDVHIRDNTLHPLAIEQWRAEQNSWWLAAVDVIGGAQLYATNLRVTNCPIWGIRVRTGSSAHIKRSRVSGTYHIVLPDGITLSGWNFSSESDATLEMHHTQSDHGGVGLVLDGGYLNDYDGSVNNNLIGLYLINWPESTRYIPINCLNRQARFIDNERTMQTSSLAGSDPEMSPDVTPYCGPSVPWVDPP